MKQSETFTITIDSTLNGLRLDQAVTTLLPQYSRNKIQQAIKEKRLLLDGTPTKARVLVEGGEEITLTMPIEVDPLENPKAQPMTLEILYEDEALLFINKPAGLVVHPGAGNPDNTLLNGLLHHHPHLSSLQRFGIVHRLDRETSGVLLIAKDEESEQLLMEQFAKRTPHRIYHALVVGEMISGRRIDEPIGRNPSNRRKMMVTEYDEEGYNPGREAITHIRILERFRLHTLLQCQLETGRTHQIRVHLQHINYPVVGDPLYGGRLLLPKGFDERERQILRHFKRQALHAYELGVIHPKSGEPLHVTAPYPKDITELLTIMRHDLTRTQ